MNTGLALNLLIYLPIFILTAIVGVALYRSPTLRAASWSQMPDRAKFLFVLFCASLIVWFVVVVYIIAPYQRTYEAKQDRKEIRDKYGQQIADMCLSPAGGTADIANLPAGPYPLKALVLKEGDNLYHEWHKRLPSVLRATNKETLGVVICVKERKETIEKCSYENTSDGHVFTIERVQYYVDLIVLNPTTGLRIAELSIAGSLPQECRQVIKGDTYLYYYGGEITYTDFGNQIKPFLSGQPQ